MTPLARMIDANANRAREALRVMEDVARFVLDDGELCGALKSLRHELAGAMAEVGAAVGGEAALLAWRDTPRDVGTGISTEAEGRRGGERDIAVAAAKRLTEALRAIEECAKAATPAYRRIEAIRYAAYEVERRLVTALGGGRAPQWRLCVLITERLCVHHPWERIAEEAVAGRADCLQLREKELEGGELLRRARWLVELARGRGMEGSRDPGIKGLSTGHEGVVRRVSVVVNDRPDIALLAGADGVHVGQGDLPVREVRRIVGDRVFVGVSTTNMEQARRAAAEGADVCGVGPMFATTTKEKPTLAGAAYLREYLAAFGGASGVGSGVPHLAIGGITPANVGELWAAGCGGVAVSSCVCGAERPREVCEALLKGVVSG